jgi:hypothetical protein
MNRKQTLSPTPKIIYVNIKTPDALLLCIRRVAIEACGACPWSDWLGRQTQDIPVTLRQFISVNVVEGLPMRRTSTLALI